MKASRTEWLVLEGKLRLESRPQKAAFYLEGPPRDVELLVSTVVIKLIDSCRSDGSSPKRQVRLHPALSHLVYSEVLQNDSSELVWHLRHPVNICVCISSELYILCRCCHNGDKRSCLSSSLHNLNLNLKVVTYHIASQARRA